jgi:hypothetical protein
MVIRNKIEYSVVCMLYCFDFIFKNMSLRAVEIRGQCEKEVK